MKQSPEVQRFWEAVKRLPTYLKLAVAILRDPDVPKEAKVILGAGGGYAVSPIDLVPGVIPVAGQMDDMYVMLMGLRYALERMPPEQAETHLSAYGVTRHDIDEDLKAVRDLAKRAVIMGARYGGRAIERIGRTAFRLVSQQLKRRDASRNS